MNNFYDKFSLSPESDAKEINDLLQKKYTEVLRRLNNTVGDAEREYKARKDLELVEEALKVFENNNTKATYDAKLNEYLSKNKKSGGLMTANPNGIIGDDSEDKEIISHDDINEQGNVDLEEYKRIQEMIQKKTIEELASKLKEQTPSNSSSSSKAGNLVIRANQSIEAGKLADAKEYIDRALDEDATLFSAWELMFFYQLQLYKSEYQSKVFERAYRFEPFRNDEVALQLGYKEIEVGMEMLDRIKELRGFFGQERYKISEVSSKMEDIKVVKEWLKSNGPEKVIDTIYDHFKTSGSSLNLQYLYDHAYMYNDARTAYDNVMKYGNDKQKMYFMNKALNTLKNYYDEDLLIVCKEVKSWAFNNTDAYIKEIRDYEKRVESISNKYKPVKVASSNILGIILVIISIFTVSLYLSAKFGSKIGNVLYRAFMIPVFFTDMAGQLQRFAYEHFIITYLVTFMVIFTSYKIILSSKNKLFARVQWLLITATFILTGFHTLRRWNWDGIIVFLFRVGIILSGLYYVKENTPVESEFHLNNFNKYIDGYFYGI